MRDKIVKIMNSNLSAAVVGAALTTLFTKSYREEELKSVIKDYESASERENDFRHQAKELEVANQRLMSELNIKLSQLEDCRYDLRESYCFWRQHSRNYNIPQQNSSERAPHNEIDQPQP